MARTSVHCGWWVFRGLLRGVPVAQYAEIPDPAGSQGILRTAKQLHDPGRSLALVPAQMVNGSCPSDSRSTVLTPLATTAGGVQNRASPIDFRRSETAGKARYSIRVKHVRNTLDNPFSCRIRPADGDGRTCTTTIQSCVDGRVGRSRNRSHAQVHVQAPRAPKRSVRTGNRGHRLLSHRNFRHRREPVVQTAAKWRNEPSPPTPAPTTGDPGSRRRRPPPTAPPHPPLDSPDPGSARDPPSPSWPTGPPRPKHPLRPGQHTYDPPVETPLKPRV